MGGMRDAVIFDMDGTLCDTSSIMHFIEGEEKDFSSFHAASAACPPLTDVRDAVLAERNLGRAILVVTSREFIWRDLTLDWLAEHGIPYDALYMRIVGDYRQDILIKKDILEQVGADGFNVLAAWDDKQSIIELWRENGIEVNVVG